jgi:hypothetical protein
MTTDRKTVDRTVILAKTIKEEYLINVPIPNSHNLHSTITEKLQKYTGLKEGYIRRWRQKTAYIIPLLLPTKGIITNKLHKSLELFNLRPALYIFQCSKQQHLTHAIQSQKSFAEQ